MFTANYPSIMQYLTLLKNYSAQYCQEPQFNLPDIAEGGFYAEMERSDKIADWILNDTLYSSTLSPDDAGMERFIKAKHLLHRGEYNQLLFYLEQIEVFYTRHYRYICIIRTCILKSIVTHRMGDDVKAMEEFQKAYQMACPENIIMPFIEYGRYIRHLIEFIRLKKLTDIPLSWLELIQTKASTYSKRINSLKQQLKKEMPESSIKYVLTGRETTILHNLSLGLTRNEIADEMNITGNTVKSMLQTIYTKLGAVNGPHAIKIAIVNNIIQ